MRGQDGSPAHEELALLFHALGDPVRLRTVQQLLGGRERACHDIAVSVTKSTFTHHLRVLEEAGLVTVRPRGNEKHLSLSADHASLFRWLKRTLRARGGNGGPMPFDAFGGRG